MVIDEDIRTFDQLNPIVLTNLAQRGGKWTVLLDAPSEDLILVILAVYTDVIPHYAVTRHVTLFAGQVLLFT